MRGDGHCQNRPALPRLEQEPEGGRKSQGSGRGGGRKAGPGWTPRGGRHEGLLSLSLPVSGPRPALCPVSSTPKLGQTGRHLVTVSHAG